MQETQVQSLVWEESLEKEMATHSSILAWEIPRTERSSRLQSMGSQSWTQLSDWQHIKWRKSKISRQKVMFSPSVWLLFIFSKNQKCLIYFAFEKKKWLVVPHVNSRASAFQSQLSLWFLTWLLSPLPHGLCLVNPTNWHLLTQLCLTLCNPVN